MSADMMKISEQAQRAFYHGAPVTDNPYDSVTEPKEYAAWHESHWEAWREYKGRHKDWFGDAAGGAP
jgi:hypothetical protein